MLVSKQADRFDTCPGCRNHETPVVGHAEYRLGNPPVAAASSVDGGSACSVSGGSDTPSITGETPTVGVVAANVTVSRPRLSV